MNHNPDLTWFTVHGTRIYSLYLPTGVVHFTEDRHFFEHVSQAVAYLNTLPPVEAAPDAAAEDTQPKE